MKPLLFKIRSGRAPAAQRVSGDDTLGRGMDLALTLLVFLALGYALDRWLGLFPLFSITLVVLASVGMFVRMRYTYEATMQRLEAERNAARRAAGRQSAPAIHKEDAA
jgi:ABC-type protease/lipase transport system fused ATPase/permease subunit